MLLRKTIVNRKRVDKRETERGGSKVCRERTERQTEIDSGQEKR